MPTGPKGEKRPADVNAPPIRRWRASRRQGRAPDMAWSACPQSAQAYGRAGQELQRPDLEGGEGVTWLTPDSLRR